nr:hypothetical protein [Tanacetum cinerariifolium]
MGCWGKLFGSVQDSKEDSEEDVEENNKEDMEDRMATLATLIKSTKVLDLSLTRKLQLKTSTSDCIDSEYDTEYDEKEPNAKKPMVAVDQDEIV